MIMFCFVLLCLSKQAVNNKNTPCPHLEELKSVNFPTFLFNVYVHPPVKKLTEANNETLVKVTQTEQANCISRSS